MKGDAEETMKTEDDNVKVLPREGHLAQQGKGQELGLVLRVNEALRCKSSKCSNGFLCGVMKRCGVRQW